MRLSQGSAGQIRYGALRRVASFRASATHALYRICPRYKDKLKKAYRQLDKHAVCHVWLFLGADVKDEYQATDTDRLPTRRRVGSQPSPSRGRTLIRELRRVFE